MGTNNQIIYLAVSQLKERGWTEAAIKKFLGEEDTTRRNPVYSSASPMRLYKETRVLREEKKKRFISWKEKKDALSKKRSEVAQKIIKKRKQKTFEMVNDIEVKVPKLKYKKLAKLACEHYNDLWSERGRGDKYVFPKYAEEDFLNRIIVNYLRHELSDYDYSFFYLRNQVGKEEAISLVRKKIFESIQKAYPKLTEEVLRQQANAA